MVILIYPLDNHIEILTVEPGLAHSCSVLCFIRLQHLFQKEVMRQICPVRHKAVTCCPLVA